MATPPNPPSGDEPPRVRSWYPAPPTPRTTPPNDPGPRPAATPEAPAENGPNVPLFPPPARTGAPTAGGRPTASTPDLGVLPPVPARHATRDETRPNRRQAAESRNDPYMRRRWPWVVAAIGVAIVVTVGGIILRNRDSDTSVSVLGPKQVEVVRSGAVPASLRADCTGVSALPDGATVAVECTPSDGASRVTFSRYPTIDALNQAFDQRIAGTGVTRNSPDDCSEVVDVEHPYITALATSGNVACFHQRRRSVLVWTMPPMSTLGVAERDDRQDQPLYDWWNVAYRVRLDQTSEPTAFTEQQSALLLHVPQSIRATCQSADLLQNATASVTCSSGTTDVFYTSYPDAVAMNAVYEAQRAASGVPVDSGLATPDACPGEGPYRADSPDGGRILCYPDVGVARAAWTVGQFSILAEAIRNDGLFPQLMTLVGRLGPS